MQAICQERKLDTRLAFGALPLDHSGGETLLMAELLPSAMGGLSNPASLLIEKVSNAIGRHFDPRQAIRMAEAEAKADRIRAESQAEAEIAVAELRQRAAERFIYEEMRRQSNMEAITGKAIPNLTEDAEPDRIDDDWIANFFDKCRIVSDSQMQELWARVLAGEGNNPGAFSRKTVNLIADLDKRDADLFKNLCRFGWRINRTVEVLIFYEQSELYNRLGINYNSLGQLETLGLVHFTEVGNVDMAGLPQVVSASYGDRQVTLNFPDAKGNRLDVGKVLLTQSGDELFRVTGAELVEGFFDYVYDRWSSESLVPPKETEPETEFKKLADRWLADTAIHSNPGIIARHPAYAQIIAMREVAISFMLDEMEKKRNRPHWFQALHDITGMTPAPAEIWGKVDKVAAAWLEWGREQGYRR
jgi:hypothetical protein